MKDGARALAGYDDGVILFSRLRFLRCFLAACGSLPPVSRLMAEEVFQGRTIVIDPGHGGTADTGSDKDKNRSSSNNATSATLGIKEKDVTLELSLLVAERIAASPEARSGRVRAVLTRSTDVNLNFTDRAATAAKAGAVCFVSIHFNSYHSQRASGPRAVVQQAVKNPNYKADHAFALALAKAVGKASKTFHPKTPDASVHDDHELHKGQGSYLFHQLNEHERTARIPACHLEVEFLDNVELEKPFFADRKKEVFPAWAGAIAAELIRQAQAAP
ncbi:MAG: hypothetical protein EOP86_02360 [Verrucomicrobiaceae bacterium]|nr:MAG: hypothetical protein EOP86_02360 [Verrucomicrobiaceae bacterium]